MRLPCLYPPLEPFGKKREVAHYGFESFLNNGRVVEEFKGGVFYALAYSE